MKLKYAQGHDPRALILAPTRELAMQVYEKIFGIRKNILIYERFVFHGGIWSKEIKQREVAQGW